jgi:electron transfer flavoprotein beta subunit
MDIIVCLKRVPDTGARIGIEGIGIREEGLEWVLNPYDEFGVEEALKIKAEHGGKVTVITSGASGGEEVLRKAIAMGADEAVYVKDAGLKGIDGHGISRVLAKAISGTPFDLILCGRQSTDAQAGYVGGALAAFLGIPLVSAIRRLKINGAGFEADREVEGGVETVEAGLPAVLTAEKGLNEPRYPALAGIMRAKKQEIRYRDLASLGINPKELENPLKRVSLAYPTIERKGKVLTADSGSIREFAGFIRSVI